jgi:hypothetical protein
VERIVNTAAGSDRPLAVQAGRTAALVAVLVAAGAQHVRLPPSQERVAFTVGAAALVLCWSPDQDAYVLTRWALDGSRRPAGRLHDHDEAVALAMLAG